MTLTVTEPELDAADEEFTALARAALWDAWRGRTARWQTLTRRRDYAAGRGGIPDVDEDASEELKDLAVISRLRMCRVVVRTFSRGLSVVGFRSPTASDDDPAWRWWQEHRLDARHGQAHRQSLTYGESYVSVLPDDRTGDPARPVIWSPLSCYAEFDEPDDLFPQWAVLIRRTAEGWSVLLVDDETVTPGVLRKAPKGTEEGGPRIDGVRLRDIEITGDPAPHGATYNGEPVCPVIRFCDETSDDDADRGEGVVEPIIDLDRAMTQVNYDRLIVARFGAHDQKLIIGWTDTADRLRRLSAAHIGAIDEHPDDVRIDRWQASPLAPYNELIREMREQVAFEAAIPLWAAGSISNVSADTAAMIEAAHQRELKVKRASLGESWEAVIRLGVAMSGGAPPDDAAEMIWDETQARTFGAVVDGITKLSAVPPEQAAVMVELLDLIPGLTQQKIAAIRDAVRRDASRAMLATLTAATRQPPRAIAAETVPDEPVPAPEGSGADGG